MIRLVLACAVLGLAGLACESSIVCEFECSGGRTERSFASCSALRDELERRSPGDTISQCEADALEKCEDEQCATSPL